MVRTRRWLIVLFVVLAMVIGAGGAFAYLGINPFSAQMGKSETITLTAQEYQRLTDMCGRYYKLDMLRAYVTGEFYEDVDQDAIDDALLHGLFNGLGDEYSCYYNAEEFEAMQVSLTGVYSGVGVTLQVKDDMIQIVKVNKRGPAYDAGVHVGDYVVAVDGEEFAPDEMDLCAAKVRGEDGTDVTLTLLRGTSFIDFTLTRTSIINETISYEMLDNNVGYIIIEGFEDATADDFEAALNYIIKQGADSFVIDLRNNPGGVVDIAVEIADMLMDEATVVYTEDNSGNRSYLKTKKGKLTDLPFVVLVNEYSASSSEIFCAGIQDNNIAPIVGNTSFGKGIIQSVESLTDGSAFKLTEWQYYSPSGATIHKVGITPDYIVEVLDSDYDENGVISNENDRQLQKALELLGK